MKTYLTLLFALLLICTGAGAALASTPDGETPAEETVCDSETGAAYGLCNAYCEAMDCESDNPSASATACTRVREKFQQITGRDLSCGVAPACPCNTPDFFADLVAGQVPASFCFTEPFLGSTDGIFVGYSGGGGAFSATGLDGQWICGLSPNPTRSITPEQGQACAQLLEQAANSQNISCVAP